MANVIITGASRGIGEALALSHAGPGTCLGLCGRDVDRLERVAEHCRRLGANVQPEAIDVRDRATMWSFVERFDRDHPVDLIYANAGVMEGTPEDGSIEGAEAAYALIQTNVLGALNSVQPLLSSMMARGRGQIAMMSSLSAFVPLADSPSYCASKAAVLSYGLSLRTLLSPQGVRVNVICPGYVTTSMMLRESGPKPFEMPPERAARIIRRGLDRDKAVIAFPLGFALATRLNGWLPDGLRRRVLRNFRFTVSDPR